MLFFPSIPIHYKSPSCGKYQNICAILGKFLILGATLRWPLPLSFFKWWLRKNYGLMFREIQHKCHRTLGIWT